MYNLAHIYFYNNIFENCIDESISLLIKSADDVNESCFLLCLALIKKLNLISINNITNEIDKYEKNNFELSLKLFRLIKDNNLENYIIYQQFIEKYSNIDLLYDFHKYYVSSEAFFTQKEILIKNKKVDELQKVNSSFYDGFGLNI